jgi:DnaK suppressor protein
MDELSSEQVEAARDRLEALRDELEQMLDMSESGSKPVSLDEPIGRLSRMDAMQQQELVKANRRQHEVRLQQVSLALRRIDDGTFGDCRRCEEPIAPSRIEARPEAPFCLDCQEEIDAAR